jgi:hypothetical protein
MKASEEAIRRDAIRYRYLRNETEGKAGDPSCYVNTGYGEGFPELEGVELDKAIDVAMSNSRHE